jgi:CheY-like chemotaxis protein
MNGDIWAESTPDRGSTFHFTAWMETSKKIPKKTPVRTQLAGKRILIVDDNSNHLDILGHILTQHGICVVKQLGGEQVSALLQEYLQKKTPIDLCILDIMMPGKSGYEVANQIRNLPPPISRMPLLALSASGTRESGKYREAGFDGFLPKPPRWQKLLPMIERLLLPDKNKTRAAEDKEQREEIEILTQHSIMEDRKHSVHILLAEDNPVNRKLAEFMLTKAGYRLDIAENGKEAVVKYASHPEKYDLVFMDIRMPEMDGREATKKIRELEQNSQPADRGPHIPIIAMTAESMKGDREKCLEAGMNDYISKPIRREIVFQMIKKWVLKDK